MKKTIYTPPTITIYHVDMSTAIMAASVEQQDVPIELYDEDDTKFDGKFRSPQLFSCPWNDED